MAGLDNFLLRWYKKSQKYEKSVIIESSSAKMRQKRMIQARDEHKEAQTLLLFNGKGTDLGIMFDNCIIALGRFETAQMDVQEWWKNDNFAIGKEDKIKQIGYLYSHSTAAKQSIERVKETLNTRNIDNTIIWSRYRKYLSWFERVERLKP